MTKWSWLIGADYEITGIFCKKKTFCHRHKHYLCAVQSQSMAQCYRIKWSFMNRKVNNQQTAGFSTIPTFLLDANESDTNIYIINIELSSWKVVFTISYQKKSSVFHYDKCFFSVASFSSLSFCKVIFHRIFLCRWIHYHWNISSGHPFRKTLFSLTT